MSILNYLPTFKVVEINRSTGLVAGHVLSQYKLAEASTLTETQGTVEFLSNGFIVGLGGDLEIQAYDATVHGQPFLVFTEELNTYMDGLKYYATAEDSDGDLYPRCIGLFVGDTFTTDNYQLEAVYDNVPTIDTAAYARVEAGVLTLQLAANVNTLFAVEKSTLPDGSVAVRFTYTGTISDTSESAEL